MAVLTQQLADGVGGAQPVAPVLDSLGQRTVADGASVATAVQPGHGNQAPQSGRQIVGCACTDIRYRARAFDERVSVCMDCGQVHKVWPKVVSHGR